MATPAFEEGLTTEPIAFPLEDQARPGAAATRSIADALAPFIGASPWHRDITARLPLLAHDARPLTLVGPPGAGKTLVARHIHWRSAAAAAPCAVVDLRRLPVEAVESELFGYAKSQLFGRQGWTPGLLAGIGEGTCILQGLERLPAQIQERLLPWLTEQSACPVGTTTPEHFPARVCIELRADGFPKAKETAVLSPIYTLMRQSVLEVAPLEARREDILPIAEQYLHAYAPAWGLPARRFSPEATRLLKRAGWPEHVRSLIAAVATAITRRHAATVEAHDFPPAIAGHVGEVTGLGLEGISLEDLVEQKITIFFDRLGHYEVHDVYDAIMEKVERPLMKLALRRTGGNQLKAARILGINRNTLRAKLRAFGMK
ncbi:MAG: sigma-54-dependent Fis family transcriptional regulator [Deltaproteobacteria bacterium]|nr:sigma-54-dependent Fis family transcriptional regulator [Deltaproteobacteria bacterium]